MAADVWSDGPVPSRGRELTHNGRQEGVEGSKKEKKKEGKEKKREKKKSGIVMMRLLALVIWSAVYGVVVAGCEQQAAGSGGVGAVLGGMVV